MSKREAPGSNAEEQGASMHETPATEPRTSTLTELARTFAWLGLTSFGGPAAHIALMEAELVRRRRWVSEARFLDLVAAAQLVPGPTSTELAIHLGHERGGARGLVVAGVAFIAPAMLLTGAFAWAYVRFGELPLTRGLLGGVEPVIVGVIVQAIARLAPKAARSTPLRVLAALALVASLVGLHELAVLVGTGLLALALPRRAPNPETSTKQSDAERGAQTSEPTDATRRSLPALALSAATTAAATTLAPTPLALFAVFLRIGAVLFGSGYVLVAFLRAELVERLHWLDERQLLDAIAVGQVTPGPVFTTATFLGYVLAGPSGALAATLGIFAPAFLFVAVSAPLVARLRASARASAFLDGVQVASLALMGSVTLTLASHALVDATSIVIGLVASALLVGVPLGRGRTLEVGPTWLLAAGALVGLARSLGPTLLAQ